MRIATRIPLCALVLLLVTALVAPWARAQTVLITGSNQGIGLEFAKEYAAKGWTVIATHRRVYARPSSCATRARYRARTRPRSAAGAGQIAVIPPRKTISPPSQIHMTSGETSRLNCAGCHSPKRYSP